MEYSQKVVSLFSTTFISHFTFITWCLVSCLAPRNQHVKVWTTILWTTIANWITTLSIFGQSTLWRDQHSYTPRTPTLVSYIVNVSCSRNMRRYATLFFALYLKIFVSFFLVNETALSVNLILSLLQPFSKHSNCFILSYLGGILGCPWLRLFVCFG